LFFFIFNENIIPRLPFMMFLLENFNSPLPSRLQSLKTPLFNLS